MSIWSSVVNGVKAVGSGSSTGYNWLYNKAAVVGTGVAVAANYMWNNASLTKIVLGAVTYTTNTAFQVLEQGLALRKAIPALLKKPESRKILNSMTYVAVWDVAPLVTLNFVNNGVQAYFRSTPYIWPVLSAIDYGVTAFTWRQGLQSAIRITALDALGPSAFNANSTHSPHNLCIEEKCTTKRRLKGAGREPIVLAANDVIVWAIGNIPYVGPSVSRVLRVVVNGRIITRLATPELCERHKFQQMMQEAVLSLGLTHEASTMLMDYLLESTTGIPPYLFYRTMRHLLLLLHVNVAAHMTLPLVKPENATLPFDPLNMYEWVCRFIADVIFSGLLIRIPKDFKFDKDAKPLIPLSPTLKLATRALKSDLEVEGKLETGFFKKTIDKLRVIALPPILQRPDNIINDPVFVGHWPAVREGAISTLDTLSKVGTSPVVSASAWAPKSIAAVLYYSFSVPKKLTNAVLMLTQEKDVWNLVNALRAWFDRHDIKKGTVELTHSSPTVAPLHGDKLMDAPNAIDAPPVQSADVLRAPPPVHPLVQPAVVLRATSPVYPLVQPAAELRAQQPLHKVVKPEELIAQKNVQAGSNPASLFTTRRRGKPIEDAVNEKAVGLSLASGNSSNAE